jgi:hypothetical protein
MVRTVRPRRCAMATPARRALPGCGRAGGAASMDPSKAGRPRQARPNCGCRRPYSGRPRMRGGCVHLDGAHSFLGLAGTARASTREGPCGDVCCRECARPSQRHATPSCTAHYLRHGPSPRFLSLHVSQPAGQYSRCRTLHNQRRPAAAPRRRCACSPRKGARKLARAGAFPPTRRYYPPAHTEKHAFSHSSLIFTLGPSQPLCPFFSNTLYILVLARPLSERMVAATIRSAIPAAASMQYQQARPPEEWCACALGMACTSPQRHDSWCAPHLRPLLPLAVPSSTCSACPLRQSVATKRHITMPTRARWCVGAPTASLSLMCLLLQRGGMSHFSRAS